MQEDEDESLAAAPDTLEETRGELSARIKADDSENVAQLVQEISTLLEERDEGGQTPLFEAVRLNARKSLEALIDAGADPLRRQGGVYHLQSPWSAARQKSDVAMMLTLLRSPTLGTRRGQCAEELASVLPKTDRAAIEQFDAICLAHDILPQNLPDWGAPVEIAPSRPLDTPLKPTPKPRLL